MRILFLMLISFNVQALAIDTDNEADTFDRMYKKCGYHINGKTKYDKKCLNEVDAVWEMQTKIKLEELETRLKILNGALK